MPAYRFTWDHFDDGAVGALAAAIGHDPAAHGEDARAFLAARVKRPTHAFVREHKDVLVRYWLSGYAGAKHIVEHLLDAGVGPMGSPRSQSGYVRYVDKTRRSKTLVSVLLDAILRYGDADRGEDEGEAGATVRRFAVLDVASQPLDPREPHDYQREAWDALTAHMAESESTGAFRGLLVMPTGAGKTFTAVRWLAEHVLSRGLRVLWLAHRQELLEHAAAELHRAAGRVRGVDKLRVRVVSGRHCATSQIDPADHVVVCSVASLARRPDIRDRLLADPSLFLVIDEAHHAPAKSYRDVIRGLDRGARARVLGLTATPTRTIEEERPTLSALFGHNVLYRVELRRLIERGILSRPRLVNVATDVDVERGVTDEDRAHLMRFNDLSAEWLNRIANLADRNAVIVEHYLANRARYGKTLMFAVNVRHAALLAEALRERGVAADYVASYRPDETEGDPGALIAAFRDGALEVLVNVEIMTEGVDVPDTRSVFLTRPTQSEILFRQMVGRGLRGPAAGGTEEAHLVAFEDQWSHYPDWEHPFELAPDIADAAEPEPSPATQLTDAVMEHLPWDLIRTVAANMRRVPLEHRADAFEAIPHGFYVLEREEEGDESVRHTIPVYAHLAPSWERLLDRLYREDAENDPAALYADLFGDCDEPNASPRDVEALRAHRTLGGERPARIAFEARRDCDPYALAALIREGDLGDRAQTALVEERYTSLARAIYPTMRDYWSAVTDALHELRYPDDSTRAVRAVPVFDPRPDEQLRPGPPHDLPRLLAETLARGRELLGLDAPLAHAGKLGWTDRLVKGWYAQARYEPDTPHGHGEIRVNLLLNSPDVSEETLRFLLWHEYLHLHLKAGHTKAFRALERRWPTCVDGDRELDTLNERFGVQYW